jgi:hypothetical protein
MPTQRNQEELEGKQYQDSWPQLSEFCFASDALLAALSSFCLNPLFTKVLVVDDSSLMGEGRESLPSSRIKLLVYMSFVGAPIEPFISSEDMSISVTSSQLGMNCLLTAFEVLPGYSDMHDLA